MMIEFIVGVVRRLRIFAAFQLLSFICLFKPEEGEQVVEDHLEGMKKRNANHAIGRMINRN